MPIPRTSTNGSATGPETSPLQVGPAVCRVILCAAAILLGACGGATPPPQPVAAPRAPRPAEADTASAAPAVQLAPVDVAPPPLPWLPLGVEWDPTTPREGQAIGIHLLQPATGRHPRSVEGSLGKWAVHFAPVDGGWFGVAPAPIGSSGDTELVLRYRLSPDSVAIDSLALHVAAYEFPFTRLRVAPRFARPPASAVAKIQEDRKIIRAVLDSATGSWLPDHPFEWPRRGRITSPFGQRRIFNGELRSRHTGVDISGHRGEPVRAAARGRVALIGHFYYTGNSVFLDHGLGVYTSYDHLSHVDVREGQMLERGQLIGKVGATGRVTGPHLHWGLHVDGVPLDARSLFLLDGPAGGGGATTADSARGRR
jgi:murein DD-endopeptidase MepM/ murein hydrolase activator NlpD